MSLPHFRRRDLEYIKSECAFLWRRPLFSSLTHDVTSTLSVAPLVCSGFTRGDICQGS